MGEFTELSSSAWSALRLAVSLMALRVENKKALLAQGFLRRIA